MFEEFEEPLDRAAIEQRLAVVCQKAINDGLFEIAKQFSGVQDMPASKLATSVLQALNLISEKPEAERRRYEPIVKELEIVAYNLKNLWQG